MRKNHKSPTLHLDKYFLVLPAFLFAMFIIQPVSGIANNYLHGGRADTTISPKELKTFEGYYKFQFQQGSDSYIHITATEKGLILKQMWDGKEISFTPNSALEFISEDGNFPLKFTKGSNGAVTQVLAFDKDLWTKTNEYKPQVIKEVRLGPSQLKALEGKYTLQSDKGEDASIQIRATEKGIILKQMWDGKELSFVAQSDLDFYCKEANFPLKFTKDKSGNAIQVLAFNRDLWNKVKE